MNSIPMRVELTYSRRSEPEGEVLVFPTLEKATLRILRQFEDYQDPLPNIPPTFLVSVRFVIGAELFFTEATTNPGEERAYIRNFLDQTGSISLYEPDCHHLLLNDAVEVHLEATSIPRLLNRPLLEECDSVFSEGTAGYEIAIIPHGSETFVEFSLEFEDLAAESLLVDLQMIYAHAILEVTKGCAFRRNPHLPLDEP